MAGGAVGFSEIAGGVCQRDMGDRLGKISDEPALGGIVFLGQEAKVVAKGEQMLEQLQRFVAPAWAPVWDQPAA